MDPLQKALALCENSPRLLYTGTDSRFHGKTGTLEVLEDMNCCAPTNNVLFAFQCETSRKVMSAPEVLEFVQDCRPA